MTAQTLATDCSQSHLHLVKVFGSRSFMWFCASEIDAIGSKNHNEDFFVARKIRQPQLIFWLQNPINFKNSCFPTMSTCCDKQAVFNYVNRIIILMIWPWELQPRTRIGPSFGIVFCNRFHRTFKNNNSSVQLSHFDSCLSPHLTHSTQKTQSIQLRVNQCIETWANFILCCNNWRRLSAMRPLRKDKQFDDRWSFAELIKFVLMISCRLVRS